MGEMTDLRERLRKRREIKIWFWEGGREYSGVALKLDDREVEGYLKISPDGVSTNIPGAALLDGLAKHFDGRTIQMKIHGQGMETDVRAKIRGIGPHQDNPRRAFIMAEFIDPPQRAGEILLRLGKAIPE